MKQAICVLFLATVSVFAEKPWPGVEYKEVRAYAWKFDKFKAPDGPSYRLIREDMSFIDGLVNKDGAVLNKSQVKRLLLAQARPLTERSQALCYNPQNAFVFYNADKKPVAFLEVCFSCLGSRSNPTSEKTDPDYLELAKICSELKVPIGFFRDIADFRRSTDWIYDPSKLKEAEK